MIDFLSKGMVQFAVNMAAVDRTELEELRLYDEAIQLLEQAGYDIELGGAALLGFDARQLS